VTNIQDSISLVGIQDNPVNNHILIGKRFKRYNSSGCAAIRPANELPGRIKIGLVDLGNGGRAKERANRKNCEKTKRKYFFHYIILLSSARS
jgi:hypothetical protein